MISIFYRISESDALTTVALAQLVPDALTTVVLAQRVRDFDFLQNIRVMTLSPRLSWLSMYVISISYQIAESDTLTTVVLAQPVRDFDFS